MPKIRFEPEAAKQWLALSGDDHPASQRVAARARDVLRRLEDGERPSTVLFTDPPLNSVTLTEEWVLLWGDARLDGERIIAVRYLGPASFA
jgi:hypothetical protein